MCFDPEIPSEVSRSYSFLKGCRQRHSLSPYSKLRFVSCLRWRPSRSNLRAHLGSSWMCHLSLVYRQKRHQIWGVFPFLRYHPRHPSCQMSGCQHEFLRSATHYCAIRQQARHLAAHWPHQDWYQDSLGLVQLIFSLMKARSRHCLPSHSSWDSVAGWNLGALSYRLQKQVC